MNLTNDWFSLSGLVMMFPIATWTNCRQLDLQYFGTGSATPLLTNLDFRLLFAHKRPKIDLRSKNKPTSLLHNDLASQTQQRIRNLEQMLDRLGGRYSTPLLMRYQGLNDQEIAHRLSLTESIVQKRIEQAKEKMIKLIRSQYQ